MTEPVVSHYVEYSLALPSIVVDSNKSQDSTRLPSLVSLNTQPVGSCTVQNVYFVKVTDFSI